MSESHSKRTLAIAYIGVLAASQSNHYAATFTQLTAATPVHPASHKQLSTETLPDAVV
jgi:hypothetical protein